MYISGATIAIIILVLIVFPNIVRLIVKFLFKIILVIAVPCIVFVGIINLPKLFPEYNPENVTNYALLVAVLAWAVYYEHKGMIRDIFTSLSILPQLVLVAFILIVALVCFFIILTVIKVCIWLWGVMLLYPSYATWIVGILLCLLPYMANTRINNEKCESEQDEESK